MDTPSPLLTSAFTARKIAKKSGKSHSGPLSQVETSGEAYRPSAPSFPDRPDAPSPPLSSPTTPSVGSDCAPSPPETTVNAPTEVWMRVRGRSMEPLLRTGDLVRIDTRREVEHGSLVAACLRGEWHIRWLFRENGFQSLNPTDPGFSPIVIEPGLDFRILGVVSCIVRPDR